MKSILKYPGSKWKISSWIVDMIPEHKIYLEPFFGSGAVFFRKDPSYIETINDIDGNIVNLFRVCREYPDELARAIELTPFSREEFENCFEIEVDDCIERARRTLVRFHQSFGTTNSSLKSWRNVQSYGGPRCATMWNFLPEEISSVAMRLKDAQIENKDALELIERYNSNETFIYLDPPYLDFLRKKNMYKHEMSFQQHIDMLFLVFKSSSKVMISGYDNDLYNDFLKGWNTAEKKTIAQMGRHRLEKIWFNYDI